MQDARGTPPLKIAPRVTRAHGERFAAKWREMQTGEMRSEAFGNADLIEWPEGPDGELTSAQKRFQDIEDEILDRVFDAVRPAIAEVFVNVARAILSGERRRGE